MKQFFKFTLASFVGVFLAGVLLFVITMGIITIIISSTSSKAPSIDNNSVLVIKLDKPIYDREIKDFSAFLSGSSNDFDASSSIGLTEFISVINKAKNDSKIKAIMLDLSYIQANGWATIEEMREALLDFKKSNKKIYAYSDSYQQNAYYLASVADEIYLNPVGQLSLTGIGGEVMYIKDLLDKFDIDVDLIRPDNNKYKSAGEMFISNKMSEANREQIRSYITSIWNHVADNIAGSRKIDVNILNNKVSNLEGFLAQDALKSKFVDKLAFKTDLQDKISKDLGMTKAKWISYGRYRTSITDIFPSGKDKIAVIYAYGGVNQGKGSDLSIGSESVVREIRKAVENKKVKAIVLRINSSGGDAIASEIITNEVFNAKKIKPVIVSMGDVAASAGYEMACGATKIVANPITITGSIGVFGVIPNFSNALKKNLGITFDTVNTHKNSTFLTVTTPMTQDSKYALQRNVENIYGNFISRVATGRNLNPVFVDSIARGRVWSGLDAKGVGLVDEFGGLSKAIQVAAKEAKLVDYGVVAYPAPKDFAQQILDAMNGSQDMKIFAKELGKPYSFFLELKEISDMKGVQKRMPYIINF